MFRIGLLWVVFLTVACAPPQPDEREQAAIDAARDVMAAHGRHVCDGVNGLIHAADRAEFRDLCDPETPTIVACFDSNPLGGGLIILRDDIEMLENGWPVIHEALHAMQWCVRQDDYWHEDVEVWLGVGMRLTSEGILPPERGFQHQASDLFQKRWRDVVAQRAAKAEAERSAWRPTDMESVPCGGRALENP